jgi:UDP-N-acetylglucosamine acyltransferase
MLGHGTRIHPSAIISEHAVISPDVFIGPFVIIEEGVRVGEGCRIKPYAHLCGPLVMGKRNQVNSGAVLGERPQHLRYSDEPTSVEIGDDNLFGEQVTVHRGTNQAQKTVIGNRNVFMANSHVGHDCCVIDHCLVDANALLGGHCIVENHVHLSGNAAVHQFVRLGRLALAGECSVMTKDLPPFAVSENVNIVSGVNDEGMRRAGHTQSEIDAIEHAFSILYKNKNTLRVALAQIEIELRELAVVQELLCFIRDSKRGIIL